MISKTIFKPKLQQLILLVLTGSFIMSCTNDDKPEVILYDKGQANVTISSDPQRQVPILFDSSTSTKVVSRSWSFPGGTPGSSVDESVNVTYQWGGEYSATLTVKYIDNQTEIKTISITVGGTPKPASPPVTGLGIYTERVATTYNKGLTPVNSGNFTITSESSLPYEGGTSLKYAYNAATPTSGFALSTMAPTTSPLNATAYNYYNIALKTTSTKKLRVRLNTSGGNYWVVIDAAVPAYGMLRDGNWHALKIPFTDFKLNGTGASMNTDRATISQCLVLRTDDSDFATYSATAGSYTWEVDDIYLTAN
jgi:hypothetical protein